MPLRGINNLPLKAKAISHHLSAGERRQCLTEILCVIMNYITSPNLNFNLDLYYTSYNTTLGGERERGGESQGGRDKEVMGAVRSVT